MRKNKGKNIISAIFYNQYFLAILGFVLIVIISMPLSKNLNQKYKIDDEILGLENEIENINSKKNSISKIIKYLDSDQYVEEQARLNLDLKKQGEEVVVIRNNDENMNAYEYENNNSSEDYNLTNAQRWWRYFFGKK